MSQSPQEVKAVTLGSRRRAVPGFHQLRKPCLRTGAGSGLPPWNYMGVCVSPFSAKTMKDHDVCLFVFKYVCRIKPYSFNS